MQLESVIFVESLMTFVFRGEGRGHLKEGGAYSKMPAFEGALNREGELNKAFAVAQSTQLPLVSAISPLVKCSTYSLQDIALHDRRICSDLKKLKGFCCAER